MSLERSNVNQSRLIPVLKLLCPPILWRWLYRVLVIKNIPHSSSYQPHFYPWLEVDFRRRYEAIKNNTGCPIDSVYMLAFFLRETLHLSGEVMEAGVWKGGTARLITEEILASGRQKQVHLFDSFAGMQAVNANRDRHQEGDFSDTSLAQVSAFVGVRPFVHLHKGWVPHTFVGMENVRWAFVHIDLDLYQSILDALHFVYPRMVPGGIIVFDDFGYASCPGALEAVTEFFADKPESPLALHTGQGVVFVRGPRLGSE